MSIKLPNGEKKDLSFRLQNLLVRETIANLNRNRNYPSQKVILNRLNRDYIEDNIEFSESQLSQTLTRLTHPPDAVIPVTIGKRQGYFTNIYKRYIF